MKRGFLNNKKAKNTAFYPKAPEKEATEVSGASTTGKKPTEVQSSYGKVDSENNDSTPKDYDALSHDVKALRGSEHLSPDHIIMTTITPGDNHNRTEWITRSATKLKLLDIPGFPQPIPKVGQLNYIIKGTEKMGKGVFTTRDIKFGQTIFAERPLLVVPMDCNIRRIILTVRHNAEQHKQYIIAEWEKTLQIVVEDRMEEDARKAFKELHNRHTKDEMGPIYGVIQTNGFSVLGDFDDDDFEITRSYSAVGKIGSRINHSCMPNTRCDFLMPSFSLQFTAIKDIKAGEQLFYTYTTPNASAQDRQKGLIPYGVVCECYACTNATPKSDRLHQEAVQRITSLQKLGDECPVNRLSAKVVEPAFELKEAMEKEGLDTEPEFVVLLCVLRNVYMRMGFRAKAEKYEAEATTKATVFNLQTPQ